MKPTSPLLSTLLLCAAGLAWPGSGPAQVLGLATAGTSVYPNQGLRRVAKLVLNNPSYYVGGVSEIQGLYGGLIDIANRYAYFGGRYGTLSKINLATFADEADISMNTSGNVDDGFVDSANGYAYIYDAGSIAKIRVGAAGVPPAEVASLPLDCPAALLDASNPDAAQHYGYFISQNSPAVVYKYLLPSAADGDAAVPTLVGSLTMNSPVFPPSGGSVKHGAIDTGAGYAYLNGLGTNQIGRISLNGAAAPTQAGVLTLSTPAGITYGRPAAIDTTQATHYAYYASYYPVTPSALSKVNLASFTEVATMDFNPGSGGCNGPTAAEGDISAGFFDPASKALVYATDLTYPMKLFKVRSGSGDSLPAENSGFFSLLGGYATPPCDGTNSLAGSTDNGATFPNGEVYNQGSVIDPTTGHVYCGTDSAPGQVIKVAYSQQSAIKGTEITVTAATTASDINFYSMAAAGHVRLGIYDNGSPQNLLWDSGVLADATSGGWITVPITSGSPFSLALPAGIYWLAWQVDNTQDVPSYTAGAAGTGFVFDQFWGAFPATLSGATPTAENWSIFIDTGSAATASPSFTASPSPSATPSATPSASAAQTQAASATASPTTSPNFSDSPSPSFTATPSVSATATVSATAAPAGSPGSAAPDSTPRPGEPVPGQVITYPNPAVPGQTLTAVFEPCSGARLSVYDWAGHRLLDLPQAQVQASLGLATWNALDGSGQPLPSGLYFLVLTSGNGILTHKFTVLRP